MAMDYSQLAIESQEPDAEPLNKRPPTETEIAEARKHGRKSKLSPELTAVICHYIRQGAFDHVAARAAGLSKGTFYRWLQEGDTTRASAKREFRDAVEEARAESRQRMELRVAAENPLAWLLKGPGRDRPGETGWTDKQTHEVTGSEGGPIVTEARVTIVIPHNGRDDVPISDGEVIDGNQQNQP
jgi:hypothetical protein